MLHPTTKAFYAGQDAARANLSRSDNPYLETHQLHSYWDNGWMLAYRMGAA